MLDSTQGVCKGHKTPDRTPRWMLDAGRSTLDAARCQRLDSALDSTLDTERLERNVEQKAKR